MNTILFLLHLLVLGGLAALGISVWCWRGSWRPLFALALATWIVAALSVSLALRNRDPLWLAQPQRVFHFERNAHPDLTKEHHKILSPAPAVRLPAEYDRLQRPIRFQYRFDLMPDGAVRNVTPIDATEPEAKLITATTRAIAAWRFGALPAAYPDARSETVQVTLTNRYTGLLSFSAMLLFTFIYGSVWYLLVRFTPEEQTTSDIARLSAFDLKRITLLVGFLAGWGWLTVYRLSIGDTRFGLAENLAQWLGLGALTYGAGIALASRLGGNGNRTSRVNSIVWVLFGVLLLLLTRFSPLGMAYGTNARLWLRMPGPLGFIKFQTIEIVKLIMVFSSPASPTRKAVLESRKRETMARALFGCPMPPNATGDWWEPSSWCCAPSY